MTRSDLTLLRRWLGARVRTQLRTGRALAFTFAFPLVLVVLFNGLNGDAKVEAVGAAGQVPFAQFYTPSIAIFSLTTACYTSVIIGIATARDTGLLKRVRGTPLRMSTLPRVVADGGRAHRHPRRRPAVCRGGPRVRR
jgi:ABC-2 type transport system permease protein